MIELEALTVPAILDHETLDQYTGLSFTAADGDGATTVRSFFGWGGGGVGIGGRGGQF